MVAEKQIDRLCIDTIRTLSMDAVQAANSGHPGTHVLVIKHIHVKYRLRAPADQREVVERVHAMHAEHCPVARSLKGAIAISTSLELTS